MRRGGRRLYLLFALEFIHNPVGTAFTPPRNSPERCRSKNDSRSQIQHDDLTAITTKRRGRRPRRRTALNAFLHLLEPTDSTPLLDYAPAAASLFNNMKLPASVVTAGMISLGFATRFPELPPDSLEKVYPAEVRARCAKFERLHIVLGLASITSMLVVVLWAAVEVNQLTERPFEPALSVWDLIHRDCDLAWSAVNSHYMLGIMGFTAMIWLRAYVLLLSVRASNQLMTAASTGTAAALFLMVSIVNRGVQQGGGTATDRYGDTILDLFWHYGTLLLQAGLDADSPGPLQVSAMGLEVVSLACLLAVLVNESDVEFENEADEDSCPVDLFEIINDEDEMSKLSARELQRLTTCLTLEEDDMAAPNGVVKEEKRMLEQSENGCSAAVAE